MHDWQPQRVQFLSHDGRERSSVCGGGQAAAEALYRPGVCTVSVTTNLGSNSVEFPLTVKIPAVAPAPDPTPAPATPGSRDPRIAGILDAAFYLGEYPDLKTALGTNLAAAETHWLTGCSTERRRTGTRRRDGGIVVWMK